MNSQTFSLLPRGAGLLCGAILAFAPSLRSVDEARGPVIAREIVSGLNSPLYATTPPHDSRHLFILQKGGAIRIYDRQHESLRRESFMAVSPISTQSEQGLLGMAFHPKFEENRYFFLNFTNDNGDTVVRRYRMQSAEAPYRVESGSELDLITIEQLQANHNGGWIGFGPNDGYLYIALGDGGGGNDPGNHGQNTETLLGAMLRIDVDNDDFPDDPERNYAVPEDNPFVDEEGRDEIWAYGLRNPWRNSFDRETGDFWIADVGQSNREEVNFQPADSGGGENYGWPLREGLIATPTGGVGGPRPPDNVDPIYDYNFSDGDKSIIGGYVYRGSAMPQLRDHYFFGDFMDNFVRSFRYDGSGMVDDEDVVDWEPSFGFIPNPASFGEAADGELFIVSLGGSVYQITQSPWYLWRNRHFSDEEIEDPAISGPEADFRGDGLPNLLKHALGLAPDAPRGALPVELDLETREDPETEEEHDYMTITVERDPAAGDVELVVEVSDAPGDAGNWNVAEVEVLENSPERLRVRDTVSIDEAPRRFYRIRATQAFQQD